MSKKRSPCDTSEDEDSYCCSEDEASPRLSKHCRAECDTRSGTGRDTKQDSKPRNIVKIHQFWPKKSHHQYTVTFKIVGDYHDEDYEQPDSFEKDSSDDDTLFKALAFSLSHHDDDPASSVVTPPKTSVSIRQELAEFGTSKQIWTQYCHHIYMQHQKSLSQLRLCDLTRKQEKKISLDLHDLQKDAAEIEEELEHRKAQEIYMKYMIQAGDSEASSGSILELIFASLKYKLNAIVLQYVSIYSRKNTGESQR